VHYIVNIPHSGTIIPKEYMNDYLISNKELKKEILEYADLNTFKLFKKMFDIFNGVYNPYSRLFFDPERYSDDNQEEMFVHGLGWFYTMCPSEKKPLRNTDNKENIKHFYISYHQELENKVAEKLKMYGKCTIIDCHSFSNTFHWFKDKETVFPDICIGFEKLKKDDGFIEKIETIFQEYIIHYNTPYSGSIMPAKYHSNSNVKSVMIEINKKLYLNENHRINKEKYQDLVLKLNTLTKMLSDF